MRCAAASDFKKGKHRGPPKGERPRPGTKLRAVYDLFMSHKGEPIKYSSTPTRSSLRDLTDYYGLDIRNVGYGRWVLAGEWFGRVYIDYIAARLAEQPPHHSNHQQHASADPHSAAGAREVSFSHGRLA